MEDGVEEPSGSVEGGWNITGTLLEGALEDVRRALEAHWKGGRNTVGRS